jgi:hypothetical protein
MHVELWFLEQADSLEYAAHAVESMLLDEAYLRFWDGFAILPKQSGTLAEKRAELADSLAKNDPTECAKRYLDKAQERLAMGDLSFAGYYFRKAGLLFEQLLCADAVVFNPDYGDYSLPKDNDGWFAVAVDFHY